VLGLSQQAGIYIGKLFKGAKPADLPIQQSTKVELMINPPDGGCRRGEQRVDNS
jgi:hypothetical protein